MANDLHDRIRGRIKRWFTELKPNCFVSGLKDDTAEKVAMSLIRQCPINSGLCMVTSLPRAPSYKILRLGVSNREVVVVSGLQLIRQGFGDPKIR